MKTTHAILAVLSACPTVLCQVVQTVAVGETGLTFNPSTIYAPVGSQVVFEFYPKNHSVVSGAFDNPCQPDGKMFSGFMAVANGTGPDVFVITIGDTNPIWYYCAQNLHTHCQAGMVGVINAPASGPDTLAAYTAAAGRTTTSGDLPGVVGGVVEPLSAAPSASSLPIAQAPTPPPNNVVIATTTVTDRVCAASGMSRKRREQRDV